MQRILEAEYKDIHAVALENDCLRALFLPEHGGKMASLVHKPSSREFLVQAPGAGYLAMQYDGEYIQSECSGFDDMFPSIDRSSYPAYPWRGVEIPDHGEVCALRWESIVGKDDLCMSVYGVRLPYRLEKRMRFESEHALLIEYSACNLSAFDMDFIWAAHPMICSEAGGRIVLPFTSLQPATLMFSTDAMLGQAGDSLHWPETAGSDGRIARLDTTGMPEEDGLSCKYYFTNPVPEGWCAYRYPSDGLELRFTYPQEKVPYLGVWTNAGWFKGYHNIALEICTGTFDHPAAARLHDQYSVLRAHEQRVWFLKLSVEHYK